MTTTIQFDAFDYRRRLESAGVPKEQAEAHAQALSDVLGKAVASLQDLVVLERNMMSRLETSELKLSGQLKEGLSAIKVEIAELRGEMGELRGEMGELRGKIGELEGRVGGLEGRIVGLEGKIVGLEGKIVGLEGKIVGLEGKIVGLEGRMSMLTWMVGTSITLSLATLSLCVTLLLKM